MALNAAAEVVPLNAIRVIATADDAVDKDHSDWDEYKAGLDESKLVFLPGKTPTVFVCNFELDAKSSRMVNNALLAARGDDGKPTLAYGSWAQAVAKVTLKDIIHPEGQPVAERIQMRKDGNGQVHDDLLAKLEKFGVVDDIFGAYMAMQKKTKSVGDSKNS